MIVPDSGAVTFPKGFLAAGVRAGIKQQGEDVALVVSQAPASAAGVFTKNVVKAACVVINGGRLPTDHARAIVANSGNANSYTGEQGMLDAVEMGRHTSELLGLAAEEVLIGSTGIIGKKMPMDVLTAGISEAVKSLSAEGGAAAARAIMTTDTRPKEAVAVVNIGGVEVRIGGMAKGAGMICPHMATMLCYITSDASITPEKLHECLRKSVRRSLNAVTIDGDSSTNDMAVIMANGMADNPLIDSDGPELDAFKAALDEVTVSLAKQIAADGEGATKLIEIRVSGTEENKDAKKIAKTVANSPLFKTAMFGCDPNWGRVLAAAGRAGVAFDPKEVFLNIGEIPVVAGGEPIEFSEKDAREYLKGKEIEIVLKVGCGDGESTVWTCDLSYDYVKINAEYHT